MNDDLLLDLAKARVEFQLRALLAAMQAPRLTVAFSKPVSELIRFETKAPPPD